MACLRNKILEKWRTHFKRALQFSRILIKYNLFASNANAYVKQKQLGNHKFDVRFFLFTSCRSIRRENKQKTAYEQQEFNLHKLQSNKKKRKKKYRKGNKAKKLYYTLYKNNVYFFVCYANLQKNNVFSSISLCVCWSKSKQSKFCFLLSLVYTETFDIRTLDSTYPLLHYEQHLSCTCNNNVLDFPFHSYVLTLCAPRKLLSIQISQRAYLNKKRMKKENKPQERKDRWRERAGGGGWVEIRKQRNGKAED